MADENSKFLEGKVPTGAIGVHSGAAPASPFNRPNRTVCNRNRTEPSKICNRTALIGSQQFAVNVLVHLLPWSQKVDFLLVFFTFVWFLGPRRQALQNVPVSSPPVPWLRLANATTIVWIRLQAEVHGRAYPYIWPCETMALGFQRFWPITVFVEVYAMKVNVSFKNLYFSPILGEFLQVISAYIPRHRPTYRPLLILNVF